MAAVGVGQTISLVACIVLTVCALVFAIAGMLSPAWQVVNILEFRAEHQHGLWLDCTRAERHVISADRFEGDYEERPLHCTYKFDYSAAEVIGDTLRNIDDNSAAGEAEHHQFFGWHKAVVILIIMSLVIGVVCICVALCAPCCAPCALIFAILAFIAMLFSAVADVVFFLTAHRVDNRFVQGLVGTYEQEIGYAFWLHCIGTLFFLLAFIAGVVTTYKFMQRSNDAASPGAHRREMIRDAPLLAAYRAPFQPEPARRIKTTAT